jgi:hypothetical protein
VKSSGTTGSLLRGALLAGVAALALLNGSSYSILFDPVAYFLYLFTRGSRFINNDILYYLSTLVIAIGTLSLAGIPAAIYERLRGLQSSTIVSLSIWLAVTMLLTLPTLMLVLASD